MELAGGLISSDPQTLELLFIFEQVFDVLCLFLGLSSPFLRVFASTHIRGLDAQLGLVLSLEAEQLVPSGLSGPPELLDHSLVEFFRSRFGLFGRLFALPLDLEGEVFSTVRSFRLVESFHASPADYAL